MEKSFVYLEATYEQLMPGEKRDNRNKFDGCRKEFNELKSMFNQQDQAL